MHRGHSQLGRWSAHPPRAALVSLRPDLEGLIVPSKAYGIAAAGRPAIFIGDRDGEVARLLGAHGCGVTVPMGDSSGLARAILGLAANPDLCRTMGERARAALQNDYDVSVGIAKWAALLDQVAAGNLHTATTRHFSKKAKLKP